MSEEQEKLFVMLKDVTVSFPYIHKKDKFGKHSGTFLLKDDNPSLKVVKNTINKAVKGSVLKGKMPPREKLCLREIDESDRDEYQEYAYKLSASTKTPPRELGSDGRTLLSEDESKIYAGCRATVKVKIWAQNNDWGKRVNAELCAIQFTGSGAPFTGGGISKEEAVEGFEAVDWGDEEGEEEGFL